MMEVLSVHRRIGLLMVLVVGMLSSCQATQAAPRLRAGPQPAEVLVARYYQILNAGMRSGDFSAMASVYAPDATLHHSTPQGQTSTFHGLNAIIAYYHRTYLSTPGIQFVRDTWYDLSPTIALNYEHTINSGQRVPARCSHLFVLQFGKIHQLFWVVYFAGAR
jgi:hypothetical protein